MLLTAVSLLLVPMADAPSVVRAFTFSTGRHSYDRRVVVGTQGGGIYGLAKDGRRKSFDLPGILNQPVTAIAEGYDGHYVWSVAGSSLLYHMAGGTTATIRTGLTTPIMRIDPWGDLIAVQGQGEVRFLDIRGDRNLGPSEVFAADPDLSQDITTAITEGPCIFAWEKNQGFVVNVARVGKYSAPREAGGTTDMAFLRAWRVNSRKQATWLGGLFLPLVTFMDGAGENRIRIGSRIYEAPRGISNLSNLTVTSQGVVAVTQSQIRAIPFKGKNWQLDEPVSLPVPAEYPTSVSGASNLVWYADDQRIFLYSVDSANLSVYLRRRPGRIRSITGDESGVWVATDTKLERISSVDPDSAKSLGYLRMEIRGEAPRFGRDQNNLKKILDSPLLSSETLDKTLMNAFKMGKVKVPTTLVAQTNGDLSYGDLVTQGRVKGFFVGNSKIRTYNLGSWEDVQLDITKPFQFIRVCKVERPVFAPRPGGSSGGAIPIAPVPIGPKGIRWIPNSTYDRPYRPAHQVMSSVIEDWMGTPYDWGGNTRSGIDCSGFVHMVYRQAGIRIPRQSQAIRWYSQGIYPTDQLKWGDVIAIDGHVLMYAGNGRTAESVGGIGVTYGRVTTYRNGTVRRFIQ